MAYRESQRPVQKNAADRRQVKFAKRIERRQRERFDRSVQEVMGTQWGRMFVWGLLQRLRIYASCYAPRENDAYMNIGRQDAGHELLGDVLRVASDEYLLMEQEQRALAAREQAEIEAAHAQASGEPGRAAVSDDEEHTNG